jgi:hypothetical protein
MLASLPKVSQPGRAEVGVGSKCGSEDDDSDDSSISLWFATRLGTRLLANGKSYLCLPFATDNALEPCRTNRNIILLPSAPRYVVRCNPRLS